MSVRSGRDNSLCLTDRLVSESGTPTLGRRQDMGLGAILAQLVKEIVVYNFDKPENPEDLKAMVEGLHPHEETGGFTGVDATVLCQCGAQCDIKTEPNPLTQAEIDDIPEEAGVRVIRTGPKLPEGEAGKAASNIGFVPLTCAGCGRKLIAAWQFACISLDDSIRFPEDDSEVPRHPASGLTFSPKAGGNETVH
jgi:hypothetical protein